MLYNILFFKKKTFLKRKRLKKMKQGQSLKNDLTVRYAIQAIIILVFVIAKSQQTKEFHVCYIYKLFQVTPIVQNLYFNLTVYSNSF